MDDQELEDLAGLHEVLADPDVYALMHRGEVEATFTLAELNDLLRGVGRLQQDEAKRRKGPRLTGFGGALNRALSGAASDIDVLQLKLRAVTARVAERQGYGPLRQVLRDILRPDDNG